ncbi:MAG TPA: nicotinate-nucleotide--dimethylbenzimidazole phosphoribosyltransferase [Nocardioidaceae bacterium]|nr:nicotinate-nucleotide--dimethylbenzimidazole phosphoribosyltransferase [Nocardioidaceae bacterium]
MTLDELIDSVVAPDRDAAAAARDRHATLAKPPGSLGRLESLGGQLAAIAGRCPPPIPSAPSVVVAAGDHGVHAQGVSDWPQDVTTAMVATMASGRAAVNAIARTVGAAVTVVDVGTVSAAAAPEGAADRRIRSGTRDITRAPAMTESECRAAIEVGAETVRGLVAGGVDLVATGEVGISNTTASACLYVALAGLEPVDVVGRGANVDDARTPRKIEVVRAALDRHGPDRDPLGALASLGGLEHAALVGVMLAGAASRVPVVVDGVITGAAALVAVALCPTAAGYLVSAHVSAEPAGRVVADRLGRPALLDLELRLGEGTGALLAVPLIRSAAAVLAETATLDTIEF